MWVNLKQWRKKRDEAPIQRRAHSPVMWRLVRKNPLKWCCSTRGPSEIRGMWTPTDLSWGLQFCSQVNQCTSMSFIEGEIPMTHSHGVFTEWDFQQFDHALPIKSHEFRVPLAPIFPRLQELWPEARTQGLLARRNEDSGWILVKHLDGWTYWCNGLYIYIYICIYM